MLTMNLDNQSSTPLYEQIYEYIKNEIKSGSMAVGSKLPSTRNLASHLNVSRNTIDMAYSQLQSEGYIESHPKRGYFISQINNLSNLAFSKVPLPAKEHEIHTTYQYDFSPFSVDLNHFPYTTWRQLSKSCLSEQKDLFLLGENQGDEPFRIAIAKYLHQSRGVNCQKDQIIVGAGVDYLLQLLSGILNMDATIAMENPTYLRAFKILRGLGHHIAPVNLDTQGIKIEELSKSNASIAYVTPSHQYPLGIVMPIQRRIALLNWASLGEDHYIIEDDHDSEFRYKGKPIPSLQGIDTNDKVIYIGTFSRAIAPAIRVGYMVLPYRLLDIYQQNFSYYSSTVSRIDQAIITNFIEQGYFERHLNRMRKVYKSKHDSLLQALKIFGNHILISGEYGGMHLVVTIKTALEEKDLLSRASNANIKLYGLSEHFIKEFHDSYPTLLMGYANLSEPKIQEGITKLYQEISSSLL